MIYSSPWINLSLLMAITVDSDDGPTSFQLFESPSSGRVLVSVGRDRVASRPDDGLPKSPKLVGAVTGILHVLCGAVVGAEEYLGAPGGNASRVRRAPSPHHKYTASMTEEELEATSWKRAHWREMQAILRREGGARDEVECCPSVVQMVETKGGKTPSGLYVELYKDGENTQRLYELSCAPGVKDMPCRFVDARLYNHSKCVQKYSYSYALVRYTTEVPHRQRNEGHFSVPGGWSMDYVIVRAGCECQIKPPRKAAHRKRLERHRQRRKNRRQEEDDDT